MSERNCVCNENEQNFAKSESFLNLLTLSHKILFLNLVMLALLVQSVFYCDG